ncbi:MAG TPA: class I SAM-dependent methyltransferase [Vicinamibacterales bacterium]|nr:class I SAM-dependent methyltransferase [Vicinamibacterales bacterium]
MSDYTQGINEHYGSVDLCARIVAAVRAAGLDPARVTRDNLGTFDEFHSGGRPSTRELARLAGLNAEMAVLDAGCGVGGPARTLAAEFGCRVTGLDLTEQFCRAAEMLTGWVGLAGRVSFRCGNALDMPFDAESFDLVWSQNSMMNIEDKGRLFREVARVLRPGGLFAFEAVLAGPVPGIHLPTFWASSPALNFLVPPGEVQALLAAAGFRVRDWIDRTAAGLERARERRAAIPDEAAAPLGRSAIVATDVAAKMANSARNAEEGHTIAVQVVCVRGERSS